MKQEPLVTITLEEYNRLLQFEQTLRMHNCVWVRTPFGYTEYVSTDSALSSMSAEFTSQIRELENYIRENTKPPKNKKWYEIWK